MFLFCVSLKRHTLTYFSNVMIVTFKLYQGSIEVVKQAKNVIVSKEVLVKTKGVQHIYES